MDKWYCDSVTMAPDKKCLGGHTEKMMKRSEDVYMCVKGCDTAFCNKCVEKYAKKQFKVD